MNQSNSLTVPKYRGVNAFDKSISYCPYIPGGGSSITGGSSINIPSRSKLDEEIYFEQGSFIFGAMHHEAAFFWLLKDCNWKYKLDWLDDYHHVLKVTFDDASGAVEFKLRFC
jgi:hypothetical protein